MTTSVNPKGMVSVCSCFTGLDKYAAPTAPGTPLCSVLAVGIGHILPVDGRDACTQTGIAVVGIPGRPPIKSPQS